MLYKAAAHNECILIMTRSPASCKSGANQLFEKDDVLFCSVVVVGATINEVD
jgi:hypothetical protein